MYKIAFIAFLLIPAGLRSQSFTSVNPHDSLLFDGAKPNDVVKISDDCVVYVTWVKGHVIGTHHEKKLVKVAECGVEEKWVAQDTVRRGQLMENDKVEVGDDNEIETGGDGTVKISLSDGSEMVIGPNSKINLAKYYCTDPNPVLTFISKTSGKIWANVKKLVGGGKYEIRTEMAIIGNRGTQFTVEVSENSTAVKVYEGVIQWNQNFGSEANKNQDKEMEQLSKDFEAGKISMEEFQAKMKVLVEKNLKDRGADYQVVVEAGYKSTISGTNKPTDPEPFDTNADRWWENINK